LLEGDAGSFCQGLDLEQLLAERMNERSAVKAYVEQTEAPSILERYALLLDKLTHVPVPVIALVDGSALGGGVGLAAAADLVLASPRASFALPEAIWGLIPAVVFPYLARRVGVARAQLMALGLRPLTAHTAMTWGLVDEVINGDSLSILHAHARRFSCMAPHAIATMKSLVSTHFPVSANYLQDATRSFYQCLANQATHQRLQRFATGETPWPEETTA
jgi:enoyl-CoA hydratase/carnithine racemase